jgi:exosome complex component RRP40
MQPIPIIPGANVSHLIEKHEIHTLGGGLHRNKDGTVIATNLGLLMGFEHRLWVAKSSKKRYLPQEGDVVIGTIVEVTSDSYQVDIGGPRLASLDLLAFDGASRRNCPNLQRGSLLFARVIHTSLGSEPNLTCQTAQQGQRKDWTSGEALFGELKLGMVVLLNTATCRRLCEAENCPLLKALGKVISFEICVGMNGRVWVNAKEPEEMVLLINVLMVAQGKNLPFAEAERLVKRFVEEMGAMRQ